MYSLYYVELYSFHSYFHQIFYHERILNFVKAFFCIYWDDHVVLIFVSVNMLYSISWFVNVEPSLNPWDESNLNMVCDLFGMLLNSVFQHFIEDFYIYVHWRDQLIILFSCCVLVLFWDECSTGFTDWIWQCFYSFYFIEKFEKCQY
jgi:hypothetical protein